MQVSTYVGLVAALVLGVPALTACSDDPPSGSPPPSTSSSPSASSPTATSSPTGPPTLPASARGTTPEAAEAFVRHYVDLINYGLETLDSEPLRASSNPDCDACRNLVEALDLTERAAGSHSGGRWTLSDLTVVPETARGLSQVRAVVGISRDRIVFTKPAKKAAVVPAKTDLYVFTLAPGQVPVMHRITGTGS